MVSIDYGESRPLARRALAFFRVAHGTCCAANVLIL